MLGGYGDDDKPPAGRGSGRATTRSSSKRPGSAAREGGQGQTKRARSHALQTPPRPLAAAAPAESLQHQRTQRPRPPPVKPIYFIQEYSFARPGGDGRGGKRGGHALLTPTHYPPAAHEVRLFLYLDRSICFPRPSQSHYPSGMHISHMLYTMLVFDF